MAAPAFAIRKPALKFFGLDAYVDARVMTGAQAAALAAAVQARRNILLAGPTATGKTTLANALLAKVARSGDRVVLIEDTRELQCAAPNMVALRTRDGAVTLRDLVRSALRLRPDRIPIGEVREAEALDLLKAWGTGHPVQVMLTRDVALQPWWAHERAAEAGRLLDDRPVRLTVELPANVRHTLVAYAEAVRQETGREVEPVKLVSGQWAQALTRSAS